MNRRDFSTGIAMSAGLAAIGMPMAAQAQPRVPEDGAEYYTLRRRAPVEAPQGRIELVEFFWYSCPHCNAFEPLLQRWSRTLPADVTLRRVPVQFRDNMVPQQRLFYALEAMGRLDELHGKVFDAIHKEGKDLAREPGIVEWAGSQGMDREKFRELYNSFAISAKARRATQLQEAYGVEGVPALGIAGRFYTDGELARNMPRAIQVAEYLIAQARKA